MGLHDNIVFIHPPEPTTNSYTDHEETLEDSFDRSNQSAPLPIPDPEARGG